MGIYSNNSTYLGEDSYVANESYATADGALRLMVECQQNDLMLFNHVIGMDFQEAAAYASNDEYMMESVQYLQEASAEGIWQSFINLVQKVAAKIKAIFEKFIAKLTALFTKDTAQLVKKYGSKFDSNDLSHMAVKGYKPLLNITNDPVDINTFKSLKPTDFNSYNDNSEISKNIRKTEVFLANCVGKSDTSSSYSTSDFSEDLEKKMFEIATDREGAVDKDRNNILSLLRDTKVIKTVENKKKDCLKKLKELEKDAVDEEKKVEDAHKKGNLYNTGEASDDSKAKGLETARAHAAITELNNATSACTTAFSVWTKFIKKAIAQSKRVFVMGATYVPQHNSSYFQAYGEVLEEEVLDYFDED